MFVSASYEYPHLSLQQDADWLRLLLSTLPHGLLVERNGVIAYINDAYAEILGASAAGFLPTVATAPSSVPRRPLTPSTRGVSTAGRSRSRRAFSRSSSSASSSSSRKSSRSQQNRRRTSMRRSSRPVSRGAKRRSRA